MIRSFRYRLYPSKAQDAEMRRHLWISKELWNTLLEAVKKEYEVSRTFLNRNQLQLLVKDCGLYSQTAQSVAHRLLKALKLIGQMRKLGKKSGFPRFKSSDQMKSLLYPQSGFQVNGNKLNVTPFGEIKVKLHRSIEGEVKQLYLKRDSSGKWFVILVLQQESKQFVSNGGCSVGIDLGLKSFASLSDGTKIQNPRFYQKNELRLARLQREIAKRTKNGRNRNESKARVARLLEHVTNARNDFLHKQSRILVGNYGLIALEDLKAQEMAGEKFGKQINDASWNKFANMIRYKAESAGCEAVFVNPRGTTKQCSGCGNEQDMPLSERTYDCPHCGLMLDRDVNAARNILAKATVGTTERHAWGNETMVSSMDQDTEGFCSQ